MTNRTGGFEVFITRVFHAPVGQVFDSWTDPVRLAQWWGPRNFTNPVCELDLRPGGMIRIDMTASDGKVYPVKGVFQKIDRPEQLVFTSRAFDNAYGDSGLEILNTAIFTNLGDKAKLTLHTVVIKAVPEVTAALEGMEERWRQSLDRLHLLLSHLRNGTVDRPDV